MSDEARLKHEQREHEKAQKEKAAAVVHAKTADKINHLHNQITEDAVKTEDAKHAAKLFDESTEHEKQSRDEEIAKRLGT